MSEPSVNDKACKIAIFDSFSKTVMKNMGRNIVHAGKRQHGTELSLFEELIAEDTYPSEHLLAGGDGNICVITTEWLYQAMIRLPENQKDVLILEYWYGMTGQEIGEIFKVSDRTIYNWKQKAFRTIKDYYERNM